MSKFVKQGIFDELAKLNEWFDDLRSDLECAPTADRGRVRARLVERLAELERFEEETALVASFCGYQSWGYLIRAARLAGEEVVVTVELPKEFLEVPTGWCYGPGKPDYNTASKQLPKTQKLVKRVFAFIECKREVEGEEWVEENKQLVTEAFLESEGWSQLEEDLWKFYKEVEPEPDPSEVWLTAAEQSRESLELSTTLPPVAVNELLEYAELEAVEVTMQTADWKEQSNQRDLQWFSYLLCAYLTKKQRPDSGLVLKVGEEAREAAALGLLYDNEAIDKTTGLKQGTWDPTTTAKDLATAYYAYKEGLEKTVSWDELRSTIRTALGKEQAKTN